MKAGVANLRGQSKPRFAQEPLWQHQDLQTAPEVGRDGLGDGIPRPLGLLYHYSSFCQAASASAQSNEAFSPVETPSLSTDKTQASKEESGSKRLQDG